MVLLFSSKGYEKGNQSVANLQQQYYPQERAEEIKVEESVHESNIRAQNLTYTHPPRVISFDKHSMLKLQAWN